MHINKKIIAFVSVLAVSTVVVSQDNLKSVASPNLIFETLALNRDIATKAKPIYLSPTDLVPSPDKTKLFVAEQTAKQIAIVDLKTNSVIKTIKLPNEVTGIAVSNDGSTLYATCSSELWPEGFVYPVDVASGKVSKGIKVGHSARSPVLSPDGATLYVCNQFNDDVSVVSISAAKETSRIKVVREPYAAKVTPDGKMLVVVNSLPNAKATDTASAHCKITLIDLQNENKPFDFGLTQGSHSVFGLTITPDGKYALITHLVGYYTLPATRIDAGWVHTNNVAILDIANKKLINDISLDYSASIGCANPWGIDVTSDSKFVCIAHAGSNEVSIIDFTQLLDVAKGTKWLAQSFGTLNKTTFRKRVTVEGRTPRALVIIDNTAYTAGFFSNFIEKVDISLSTTAPSGKIELGSEPPMTHERNGEYQYYCGDIYHCVGAWQSCNSCHPHTRPDALNWILNGANGAQKNAKSMLYSWWTPRTNWNGKRENTQESIWMGIKFELGLDPKDSVEIPLQNFLMRLKPVPSPYLENGKLSESAKRGRDIFYDKGKVDCIECHPGKLFTNLKNTPSIADDIWDATSAIKVPSLNECWRTAPWDHIGSTIDMDSLNINKRHSTNAYKLSADELKDLSKFILSL